MTQRFNSFGEFYDDYLAQHQSPGCRRLHFIATLSVIGMTAYVLWSQNWWWLLSLPVLGYGFAWMGHICFERNRPATFGAPLYSLIADWVMFKDMLIGRVKL